MTDETSPQPTSPFAAPAQSAPPPAEAPATEAGDTSFLDGVSSQEPLIKPCTVKGVIVTFEEKVSATSGNPFFNLAVQLYPDDAQPAVYDDGTKVPQGKRLQSTMFLSSKTEEGFKRTGRAAKNLALALRDVPLAAGDAAYKAWPPAQKVGVVNHNGVFAVSTASFQPVSQWIGTKVMVQVTKGRDMDGNPRNEFNLLAASTRPVERKAR